MPRIKGYEGHFTQGLMDGPGTMYYEKTGNVLFRGQFKSGNFYNGTLGRGYVATNNTVKRC